MRYILLSLLIVLVSCNSEESVEPTPKVDLEFSTSPIDLQGMDVNYASDIPYDEYEDTKFDIFLPNVSEKTGLVVFIHGGGFTGGDKAFLYSSHAEVAQSLLANDIAVATVNYRLIGLDETEGVLKCLNDSRRAIQYIRYISETLNIDKEQIALFGSSAGAGTSLWIATNDDFADQNASDPVLRESTRVKGVAVRATQASYDIENRWINDVFEEFNFDWDTYKVEHQDELLPFYGVSTFDEYESATIDTYRQQVDILSLLSSDDPEIWAANSGPNDEPVDDGQRNHHPNHVRELREFAQAAGVEITCSYGNPILFQDTDFEEDYVDFLIRKLSE